jgi:hypothetical protein
LDKKEALALLREHLDEYRRMKYSHLVTLIDQPQTKKLTGKSGTVYQIEIEVFWDGAPGTDLRVRGDIDDGGLRPCAPLCEDFILAEDGHFVGE